MLKLSQACIHGLEVSFTNSNSGGLASVFYLLEIAHTHYWSKEGCDSSTSGFDSQVGVCSLLYVSPKKIFMCD